MFKLKFDPNCFEEIDDANLAWELTFTFNWDWQKVLEKTVLDVDALGPAIETNDKVRGDRYPGGDPREPIILQERSDENPVNGLEALTAQLEERNKAWKAGELPGKEPLYHDVDEAGIHRFTTRRGEEVMSAVPCCPLCHARLPIGWERADAFRAISLLSLTEVGKTSLLYSWLHNDLEALDYIGELDRAPISIQLAHLDEDTADAAFAKMIKEADELCCDHGVVPDHSVKRAWIPPVFLEVEYKDKTYIFGIYDNSGENLKIIRKNSDYFMPYLRNLVHMDADIFLVDPKDMNIVLPKEKEEEQRKRLAESHLRTPEEQAEYQRCSQGEVLQAKDILNAGTDSMEEDSHRKNVQNALIVYDKIRKYRMHRGVEAHTRDHMSFYGLLVKSDLLRDADVIRDKMDRYGVLFCNSKNQREVTDPNLMQARSEMVEDMIRELNLFDGYNLDQIHHDYGDMDYDGKPTGRRSVSWHVVSALGCGSEDKLHLDGAYAPVHLADPLLDYIFRVVREEE